MDFMFIYSMFMMPNIFLCYLVLHMPPVYLRSSWPWSMKYFDEVEEIVTPLILSEKFKHIFSRRIKDKKVVSEIIKHPLFGKNQSAFVGKNNMILSNHHILN